jgi:hypothetical protein
VEFTVEGAVMTVQTPADPGYRSAAEAQAAINQHPITLRGRCLRCEVEGPCGSRYLAERALHNARRLPRRTPGATRPELLSLSNTSAGRFRGLLPARTRLA